MTFATKERKAAGAATPRDLALQELRAARDGNAPVPPAKRDMRGIRLTGEDLSGLDLSGMDFSDADLSGADLSSSRLVGAKLLGARLHGAKLDDSELLNADLAGADMSETVGRRAGFGAANLTGANLFGADLEGAGFAKATLRDADLRAAKLRSCRFREATLEHAELSRADMRGADLEKCDVAGASFVDTDLREARLRGISGYGSANWIEADILGADFCGAYLARRAIRDQNYLHEFRNQSRFSAAIYQVWWITSDCGRSFLRWGLWTLFFVSLFAAAFELVALDYGDHRTFLSSFYYSVVTLTTLGYGDVVPASPAAQILAMLEVVIGYVMLGGLLSIFANKMSRRAD
jgi:uncharacterized protein YjbI with pentapeptide repeats